MKRKLTRWDVGYKESWISRMWWRYGGWIIAGTTSLMVGALCWLMYAVAVHDARAWQSFSEQHHCRVAGKMSGDVVIGTGLTSNGQVTTTVGFTGEKTGYICDDGVTYWR